MVFKMKMPMLSIGMLVMLITGASAVLNTGDEIQYATGTCSFANTCAETCTKDNIYSVTKNSGSYVFTPKSTSLGGCTCTAETYAGTLSGDTFTGTGFTITTTSNTAVLSIPSSSCSSTWNIDTGSSSGTSEFNVQTGSGISYSSVSGSCPQSDECSTACAQGGYTVTVGTDSLKFDPKSGTINGDCTCYSISLLGGTYSGSQFTTTVESSPFTVTTTSTTLTAAYEGCSTYYTIDGTGASSSGFTLTGLLGLTLAIIVALVLA